MRGENGFKPLHWMRPSSARVRACGTRSRGQSGRIVRDRSHRRPDASEIFMEPKRAYKSCHYKAKTAWSSARRGMLSAAGRPNIVVGSPPEFKGEPDIWAPEEVL